MPFRLFAPVALDDSNGTRAGLDDAADESGVGVSFPEPCEQRFSPFRRNRDKHAAGGLRVVEQAAQFLADTRTDFNTLARILAVRLVTASQQAGRRKFEYPLQQ